MATIGPDSQGPYYVEGDYQVVTSLDSGTDTGAHSGQYSGSRISSFEVNKTVVDIGALAVRRYDPELSAFLAGEL